MIYETEDEISLLKYFEEFTKREEEQYAKM